MGVFKKFIGAIAREALFLNPSWGSVGENYVNVPTFKAIDGTVCRQYYVKGYKDGWDHKYFTDFSIEGIAAPYHNMTAVATTDEIDNYNVNDYEIIEACTTTSTYTQTSDYLSVVYTITLNNSTNSDVTVNCIKFKKNSYIGTNGSGTGSAKDVLMCGYYLDAPLTIAAGESKTIVIEMKVGTDVSVNET